MHCAVAPSRSANANRARLERHGHQQSVEIARVPINAGIDVVEAFGQARASGSSTAFDAGGGEELGEDLRRAHLGDRIADDRVKPRGAVDAVIAVIRRLPSRGLRASARRAATGSRAALPWTSAARPIRPGRKMRASIVLQIARHARPEAHVRDHVALGVDARRDLDQLEALRADAEHRALGDEQRDLPALAPHARAVADLLELRNELPVPALLADDRLAVAPTRCRDRRPSACR